MPLSRAALLLVVSFVSAFEARAAGELPKRSTLRGKTVAGRIGEIEAYLKARVSDIPTRIGSSKEADRAMMLYFLEDNLKSLKEAGVDCKRKRMSIEQAKLRNLPRGASSSELAADSALALESLIGLICDP